MGSFGYSVDYVSYGVVGEMGSRITMVELYENSKCDRFLWEESFETSFLENCGAKKGDVFSVHRRFEAQDGLGMGEVSLTHLEDEAGRRVNVSDINYEMGLEVMRGFDMSGLRSR
ncbi:hypothetical protein HNV12_01330 [Methanococcoides sp. SA1]|nr:hypothetical protein [Methanococcoides sp. SA1]